MRISDWSSDVCSSDLRSLLVRRATGILTGVSKAGQGNNRPPCLALRSNRSHGSLTFVIRWNERHAYCKLWRYSRPESSNLLFFDQSIGPNYDNRSGRRPCGCWRVTWSGARGRLLNGSCVGQAGIWRGEEGADQDGRSEEH